MTKNLEWIGIPVNLDDYVGFVYRIVEIDTGMEYIGIKRVWRTIKYPPLKGKKNKRHIKKETKWRTYNSSNPILMEKIPLNPENYEKHVIKLCTSVTDMKAYETYTQLQYYFSGNWDKLYNEVVNLRVRIRKGL